MKAQARTHVAGVRVSDAEALWYDRSRWPSFVDGYAHTATVDPDWPQAGATHVWDSHPGGRGRVIERVTAYEPRTGQTAEVEDEKLSGVQRLGFAPEGDGVDVTLALDYRLKNGGPLQALTDLFFIRRALTDSNKRTLSRFARELRAETDPDLSR